MFDCWMRVQVLESIDSTPILEAPAPGKLLTTQALKLPAGGFSQAQLDQEVKESMQSHFD